MRRDTACFSMYSLMSIRTIASCESNMNSASARASSVLPTPVGPRKRKEPIGLSGACRPAAGRRCPGPLHPPRGAAAGVDLLLQEHRRLPVGLLALGRFVLGELAFELGDLA